MAVLENMPRGDTRLRIGFKRPDFLAHIAQRRYERKRRPCRVNADRLHVVLEQGNGGACFCANSPVVPQPCAARLETGDGGEESE